MMLNNGMLSTRKIAMLTLTLTFALNRARSTYSGKNIEIYYESRSLKIDE